MTAWTSAGGGYQAFQAAWPATGFEVAVLSGGTDREPVPILSFPMVAHTDAVPAANNNGETKYNQALWYSGSVDIWAAGWPTTDNYVTLQLPSPAAPTTLMAYTCADAAVPASAEECAAAAAAGMSGAGEPAAAATRRQRSRSRSRSRRSLHESPAALAGGARPSPAAAAHAAPSPPPVAPRGGCLLYYREVSFTSGVTLLAAPPMNPNTPGNWSLATAATACGTSYDTLRIPVSSGVYAEDVATQPWPGAPPAWCGTWGSLTTDRPNGTLVTVRSAQDPVVAAGLDTDCTDRFGIPVKTYRRFGAHRLVLPGLAASAAAAAVLLCLVARRRAGVRVARGRFAAASEHEGTPLAPPGVYSAPPEVSAGGGYGAADGPATARDKGFTRVSSKARK